MPLTRTHVFIEDEVPTAAQLNAEFNAICNKFSANITAGDLDPNAITTSDRYVNAALYSTIREAVNAAAALGLNVWIPEGSYVSDSEPISVPSGMSIYGVGADKVSITPTSSYAYEYLFAVGINTVIEGITIKEPVSVAASITTYASIRVSSTSLSTIITSTTSIRRCVLYMHAGPVITNRYGINAIGIIAGLIIQDCVFVMTSNSSSIELIGIIFDQFTTAQVLGCVFTGGKYHIKQRLATPVIGNLEIKDCTFNLGDASAATTNVYTAQSVMIQACVFYIATNIAIDSQGASGNIFGCTFIGDGHATDGVINTVSSILLLLGNSFDSTTLIVKTSILIANKIRCAANITTGIALSNQFIYDVTYGKYWSDNQLLRLGDVFVWLRWNTTSSINQLYFKQGTPPTNSTDGQAYVNLTNLTGAIPL